MDWSRDCAAVIPCYNEAAQIGRVVTALRRHVTTIFVVDDHSTDATVDRAKAAGAEVLISGDQQGKGYALRSGLHRAKERGFSWAVVLDGDGQHSPDDLPELVARASVGDVDLVVGNRMGSPGGMPRIRRWTNQWMSWFLSRRTGYPMPDTQCGYRLVRLDVLDRVILRTGCFEIESEMIVAFLAAGCSIAFIPIRSIYSCESGLSKIRPWRDARRWWRWVNESRERFEQARAGAARWRVSAPRE